MRKIKFRAWDGERLKPVTVWGFSEGFIMTPKGSSDEEDYVVMQYTGIRDANLKEIYEGDVVIDPDGKKFLVVYEDFMFNLKDYYDSSADYPTIAFSENIFKIIGNIYENPELLEESK